MNETFAKLVAIAIVGGVAKALFAPVRPIINNPTVVKDLNAVKDVAAEVASEAAKKIL